MPKPITLKVRVSGTLGEHVAANVGDDGGYENASEYVCDLIRRDKARADAEGFMRLEAELTHAFASPDSTYHSLTAKTVIKRNAQRRK